MQNNGIGILIHFVRMQNCTIILKNDLAFLMKLSIHLPNDSGTSFLGIYPRKAKTCVYSKNIYTNFFFLTILCLMTPDWKEPKCL